jgi:predicted nucleic acid-binding protein
MAGHRERILPVDESVAEEWGRLSVPDLVPVVDGLMAATAKIHGLTLATRNVRDVARTGVACVNPFEHEG